jgi:LysM repeat protein
MKPATKILLAVLTLFMGVIVVYWGIVYGGGEEEQPIVVNDPAVAGPERPTPSPPDGRDEAAGDLVPVGDLTASRSSAEPAVEGSGTAAVLGREEPMMPALEDESEGAPPTGAPMPPSTLARDEGGDAPQTAPADSSTPGAARGAGGTGEASGGDVEPVSSPPLNAPERTTAPTYAPYVVKAGDTLSSIAQGWFGDAARWDLIQEANPAIDPNRLRPGQVLRLPARSASRDPAPGTPGTSDHGGTYTVRSGDTLSFIARTLLGEERHWRLIYEANRSAIGPNPDAITVGMKLIIPRRP